VEQVEASLVLMQPRTVSDVFGAAERRVVQRVMLSDQTAL
jgi:hypothetical protein